MGLPWVPIAGRAVNLERPYHNCNFVPKEREKKICKEEEWRKAAKNQTVNVNAVRFDAMRWQIGGEPIIITPIRTQKCLVCRARLRCDDAKTVRFTGQRHQGKEKKKLLTWGNHNVKQQSHSSHQTWPFYRGSDVPVQATAAASTFFCNAVGNECRDVKMVFCFWNERKYIH